MQSNRVQDRKNRTARQPTWAESKAARVLEKLTEWAYDEQKIPNTGLLATLVEVYAFLKWVEQKAAQRVVGSKGGTTASASIRAGLYTTSEHFGMEIDCR